jgi:transcriptional regulator with XRE-family HTH domain
MGNKPANRELPPLRLNLQQQLDRKGWSQERLAEEMDTSDATINRIIKGKQNWKQDTLQRAAQALDCDIFDLLPAPEGSILSIWQSLPEEKRADLLAMMLGLAKRSAA